MATQGAQKPAPDAGFYEKNFKKLKQGKLWEYIASRTLTFVFGVSLGFLYIRDAAYVHSPTGIPLAIIFVGCIIFPMNGLRKMMWGFIKMNDAAWDSREVEKPHQPHETRWQRFFLRLPIGQRRHLISRQSLAAEGLACVFIVAYSVSCGIKDNLFILSSNFPFVLNPDLFSWSGWGFPENYWHGLAIVSVAVIMSYINNSLFLTKIPQVRKVLAETLRDIPRVDHLALYFPMQVFKLLRSGSGDKPCRKGDAEEIARRILAEYPDEMITHSQKQELEPELIEMICTEDDPLVVIEFLKKRLAEFKAAARKR